MKIIVGVDTAARYRAALNLATRLRFENPTWTLAHCVEVPVPITGYVMVPEAAHNFELATRANDAGEATLKVAKAAARAHEIVAEFVLLAGNAATALVEYSDSVNADLVCIHSNRMGLLDSLSLSSVSRGLEIESRHSILISKGEIAATGRLKLLFATDHSEYADQALEKLIELAPKGVASIKVVTALTSNGIYSQFDFQQLDESIEDILVKTAERKTMEAVELLRAAGYEADGEVVDKPVNAAIDEAMKDSGADLLVLGAQGHGFISRMVLGSTALHQVMVEPYSVLILRP